MLASVRISGKTLYIDGAHIDGLEPGRLGRRVELSIAMTKPFAHPVALAKLLTRNGVALADPHALVNRLVEDRLVYARVITNDLSDLIPQIEGLGLRVASQTTVKVVEPFTGASSAP